MEATSVQTLYHSSHNWLEEPLLQAAMLLPAVSCLAILTHPLRHPSTALDPACIPMIHRAAGAGLPHLTGLVCFRSGVAGSGRRHRLAGWLPGQALEPGEPLGLG